MVCFLYKLIPPRPTFLADMTPDEASIMQEHFAYWSGLIEAGNVIVYGPVADPAGAYGIAVVEAHDRADVQRVGEADPAVSRGLGTFEIYDMPDAVVQDAGRGGQG